MTVTKTEGRPPAAPSTTRATVGSSLFPSLRGEFDRLWDSAFLNPMGRGLFDFDPFQRRGMPAGAMMPRMDVVETDPAIKVTVELPGMDQKDINISVADDLMTIRGEKKVEHEETEADYHLNERSYGAFARSFLIPETVDATAIEAVVDKGVLTLTMPKTAKPAPAATKIEVKTKTSE